MNRKVLALMITCASLLPLGGSFAQNVILNCGFDNYAGTLATVPAGFTITWNSTSNTTPGPSASFYISAGNFGLSAPSYKFGVDSATLVTPYVSNADSLSFWAKGNSISGPSTLYVSYSTDSINWTPITSLNNLPTASTTLSIHCNRFQGTSSFSTIRTLEIWAWMT